MVHTSTSEVYGTAQYVPIDEKHPLQGQSPYSASKIGADKMAEAFRRSFDLPVVTLRPFNTFGPRQSPRAVIPTIISQCLAGDTVHLGSLGPTRDFLYVSDSVEGYLRAAVCRGRGGRDHQHGHRSRDQHRGPRPADRANDRWRGHRSKPRNGGLVPTQVRSNGCSPTLGLLACAWGGRLRSAWKTDSPARSNGFAKIQNGSSRLPIRSEFQSDDRADDRIDTAR